MFDEIVVRRMLPGLILKTPIARRLSACSGGLEKTPLPEAQQLRPVLPLQICREGHRRDVPALARSCPDAHGTGERIVKLLGRLLAGTHQAFIIFGYAGFR